MPDKFNQCNSDIRAQSIDGIEFKLHRTLLDACTGRLPSLIQETNSAPIKLEEPANVLRVLFEFIYPRDHPDLEDKDFEFVITLSHAVMKYRVYSAMFTCNSRLRSLLPNHAAEICAYALKYNQIKLADTAAPYIARCPLGQIVSKLPVDKIIPWIKYHEQWTTIFVDARRMIKNMLVVSQSSSCHSQAGYVICNACRLSLYNLTASLEELQTPFALGSSLTGEAMKATSFSCCGVQSVTPSSSLPSPFIFAPPPQASASINRNIPCQHVTFLIRMFEDKVKLLRPFSDHIIHTLSV